MSDSVTVTADTRPTFAAILADRRLWLMTGFGFASGLPLPLSGFTLRYWLSEGHVGLGLIGLTAEIGLAYSLKFLWAPVFDNAAPGWLGRLGRRRGWLMAVQPLLTIACLLMVLGSPAAPILLMAFAAVLAFCSASQDTVIDAWRIETFPQAMQGTALAGYVWGYRAALLISGAGAIALATPWGWHGVFAAMAALTLLGPVITLLAREPAQDASVARMLVKHVSFAQRFARSVIEPLAEFLCRRGALVILLFIVLFRLGEALAGTMLAPFYRHLGFDRAQVAVANGPISLAAVLIGAALGGWLVARIGTGRALLITGCFQTLCMFMYLLLSYSAGSHHTLMLTAVVESFAEGLADAAFLTYLSSLCSLAHTATQYALLSSIAALASRTVGGLSGYMVPVLGWHGFYAMTALATLPSIAVMVYLLRHYPPERRPIMGSVS
ncbi:MAG TPA: MFS transporter [Acidisoma sp.]|jgi:PAT family beta-lactamase induction signal transducer AmpG|nr:MFS transporter [Acidisoma sp.]